METISPTLCPLFLIPTLLRVNAGKRSCAPSDGLVTKRTKAPVQRGFPIPAYPGPQLQPSRRLFLSSQWNYAGAASDASSLHPTVPINFDRKIDQISVPHGTASVLSGIELKQNGKTHHKQIL